MTIAISQDQTYRNGKITLKTTHDIYFRDARTITKTLKKESVHLVVTSPPYWSIKDYGNPNQIGYSDSLDEYFNQLNEIWGACIRVLQPGCKLAINIGDQFIKAKNKLKGVKQIYQIIPIHSRMVNEIVSKYRDEIVYLGSILWSKVSTSNTSGGGKVMGSVYYPRNGYFFINREYIAIFRKVGKDPRVDKLRKELSKMTLDEWRTYFNDTWTWNFTGIKQDIHPAMFPEELPKRLIRMYSFVGDTVLDPFLGSGTTTKVAASLGRNSIGFEIGFEPPATKENKSRDWKKIIKEKIEGYTKDPTLKHVDLQAQFNYYE